MSLFNYFLAHSGEYTSRVDKARSARERVIRILNISINYEIYQNISKLSENNRGLINCQYLFGVNL